MKKKKYIKIPKDFFKGIKFDVNVSIPAEFFPQCPDCRAFRNKYIKSLSVV